jgi:methionine sulfoxide reductase catalytic subunit
MLIRQKPSWFIDENETTNPSLYHSRRTVIKAMGLAVGTGLVASAIPLSAHAASLDYIDGGFDPGEDLTPQNAVTGYNNFYEFGTGKEDPARYGGAMTTEPWTIEVEGEVARPGTYDFEDFIRPFELEERIYRMRCVEAWSMVIPWVGVPLHKIIARLEPTANAKYIVFETLNRPSEMPGIRRQVIDYPYIEGLRMDEAMNPLALLAVGLYGETLLNQNGAPIRLVVPWKYGFKGVKSIVKIRLQETRPINTWQLSNSREYGFFANVNPNVDHPRWPQSSERRIGEFFRRDTLMFNGYADQVAHMYDGMNLRRNF